jgi:8-oxo-dGTP pyrophosphatase MutT (NUDIX family)
MTMPTESPWTTTGTAKIYENNWISVREDKVINPSGGHGIYGVVEFKNQAIAIVPVDAEGNTWLVGQYRYPLQRYSWEVPMGGQPIAEDPAAGAHRELKEETGLTAGKLTEVLQVDLSNCVSNEVGIGYLAEDLTIGEPDFDDTEDLAIWKLPLYEAINMAMKGEITDCFSVAILLKVNALRVLS